jgi:hypothetical protein
VSLVSFLPDGNFERDRLSETVMVDIRPRDDPDPCELLGEFTRFTSSVSREGDLVDTFADVADDRSFRFVERISECGNSSVVLSQLYSPFGWSRARGPVTRARAGPLAVPDMASITSARVGGSAGAAAVA